MHPEIWIEYANTRNPALLNQLIKGNERLVYKVAHRWIGRCCDPLEDLVQIGSIGLLKAIERFDPHSGVAFSSFAVPYINGEILHHIRDHFDLLKMPRSVFEEANKVRRLKEKMAKAGRVVSEDEAAAALGISGDRWQWVRDASKRKAVSSLDESFDQVAESEDLSEPPLSAQIHQAIASLPKAQRESIMARFFGTGSQSSDALIEIAITSLKQKLGDVYYA